MRLFAILGLAARFSATVQKTEGCSVDISIDQRQDRVPVQECPNHASPAVDLTVQWLNHVVGEDTRPVFCRESHSRSVPPQYHFFRQKNVSQGGTLSHTNSLGCIFLHAHAAAENVFICYQ